MKNPTVITEPTGQGRNAQAAEVLRKAKALLQTTADTGKSAQLKVVVSRLETICYYLATCNMDFSPHPELKLPTYDKERAKCPNTDAGHNAFQVKLEQELSDINWDLDQTITGSVSSKEAELEQQVLTMQQMLEQMQREIAELKESK